MKIKNKNTDTETHKTTANTMNKISKTKINQISTNKRANNIIRDSLSRCKSTMML
jgi:hypothetical protein